MEFTRILCCVLLFVCFVTSNCIESDDASDYELLASLRDPTLNIDEIHLNDTVVVVKGNHKIAHLMTNDELEKSHHEAELHKNETFDNVTIDIPWGLPVEVQLIATLPKGVGSMMYKMVTDAQKKHPEYILDFNEASAKIMNTNFDLHDPTAVYTFSVDKEDLVFHRHEGHRCITGMTGSGGALMKFSTVTNVQAKTDPQSFIDNMFVVDVPADSIFILRFNGMVYHQFGPKDPEIPAFWAMSVHTNERGGELTPELLKKVLDGEGNIPLLTEPIPEEVDTLLKSTEADIMKKVTRYYLKRVD